MIRSLGSQNYILRYTSEKTVATLDVFTSCVFDGWFIHGCRFEQDASVLDDLYLDRRGTAFNIGWYFIVNTQCNSVKCEFISNVIAMHDAGKLPSLFFDSLEKQRIFHYFASFLGLSMLSTEFILGLPLKQTGIYPGIQEGPHHVIQYGVTLVLSSHDLR